MEWAEWSAEAFTRAQDDRRVILVNVAASWCHWCHVMDERTYGDERIAGLLRERFVAIRVDSDARPDVAERYSAWGWPATAILTPDGEPVMELRGFQKPDEFLSLLEELATAQASGDLNGRRPAPAPAPRTNAELAALRDEAQARLDGFYAEDGGGWGRGVQKYPLADPIEHAFARAAMRGEDVWQTRALETLEGTSELIDPVWGGVYQYSLGGVWTRPHYEKIAKIQAGAIRNFAQAYRATGDRGWLDHATAVVDYLESFMVSEDGGFFTSQDADLRSEDGASMVGREYFALDDEQRHARGVPRIDRNVYADLNGHLISALAELYAANPSDERPLTMAIAAAERIERTHRTHAGAVLHGEADGSAPIYLRDQAASGFGLLMLFRVTGERRWLAVARERADFVLAHLTDPTTGAFWANTPDPAAIGALATPRRPLEENALAARLLLGIHEQLDHGEGASTPYKTGAERALRALADPNNVEAEGRMIGGFVLALDELVRAPVWITVSGAPEDPATGPLLSAALQLHEPRKVVELAAPGTLYPDIGKPAIYLCTDTACSMPIKNPDELPGAASAFIRQNFSLD